MRIIKYFSFSLVCLFSLIIIFWVSIPFFPQQWLESSFLKNNTYAKTVGLLNTLIEHKNESVKEGTSNNGEEYPNAKGAKKEDGFVSNILSNTSNILSKTSILLAFFAALILITTVVMGILGLTWFKQYYSLKASVGKLKETSLDSILFISASIHLLHYTHIIPSSYYPLLKLIHEVAEDDDYSDIIKRNHKYWRIMLLNSMYYWSIGEYIKANRVLEKMENG